MSAISNGRYTITNVKYTNSAVDLNGGNSYSPITGYALHGGSVQTWIVRNIGENHRVLIESAHTGSFASVSYQVDGPPLAGSPNATVWVAEAVSQGVYRIKTSDGQYAWSLTSENNYAPIVIKPANSVANATNAQWKFNSV